MVFTYDGTFEGLLSAIFEAYRLRVEQPIIETVDNWQESLFEKPTFVETNEVHAKRVLAGLRKQGSAKSGKLLWRTFHSELPEISQLIYTYINKAMKSPVDLYANFGDPTVLKLHQIDKKIGREVHRMHAFVRFQKTRDDIYYAVIEPDFNVLPLLPPHFEKRYPAQHWLIYDAQRRYGIYYNQQKTEYITFADDHRLQLRQLSAESLAEAEPEYQLLWKTYFDSVNIAERKNMKLHLQHVPKRYWKYLSEKREQFPS